MHYLTDLVIILAPFFVIGCVLSICVIGWLVATRPEEQKPAEKLPAQD